jgi:hypothetical protein
MAKSVAGAVVGQTAAVVQQPHKKGEGPRHMDLDGIGKSRLVIPPQVPSPPLGVAVEAPS